MNSEDWKLSDFLLPDGVRILHLSQVGQLVPGDHVMVRFVLPVPDRLQGTRTIDAWHHGIFNGEHDGDLLLHAKILSNRNGKVNGSVQIGSPNNQKHVITGNHKKWYRFCLGDLFKNSHTLD